ncbi:MAG: hypothetical protein ABIN24_07975, partial [Dyadobacter sp.]
MGIIVLFVIIIIGAFIYYGVSTYINNEADRICNYRFDKRREELLSEVEKMKISVLADIANQRADISNQRKELQTRQDYIIELRKAFEKDYFQGRKWLAEFVGDADKALDVKLSDYLTTKKHPALVAADVVKQSKAEKRDLVKQLKFLEYQIKSYKEYFPLLEEFEDEIMREDINFTVESVEGVVDNIDRVALYLTKEEYKRLSPVKRNQLALDNYRKQIKKNWEIGRLYERFLGYKYESENWDVSFFGAIKGFEDMGRDLVCKKSNQIHIVQAKCWASEKIIHEKHIFQLFGTTLAYRIENSIPEGTVKPVF